jgi:hypothetical protein
MLNMPATKPARRGWWKVLSTVPAALLAVLPNAHCPFCLGAYGAFVSSLGLGFLANERVMTPLIAAMLVFGIAAVAWSTKSHRHPGPLVVTIVASLVVVAARLVWDVPWIVYSAGGVLVAASVWNLWLKRPRQEPLVQLKLTRRGAPV